MKVTGLSGRGHSNSDEVVSGIIEKWDDDLLSALQAQALEGINQRMEAPHEGLKMVDTEGTEWQVKVYVPEETDEGVYYSAGTWSWGTYGDDQSVGYYVPVNDLMEEIEERLEEAIIDAVAAQSPFSEDVFSLTAVRLYNRDKHDDSFQLRI